MESQDSYDVSVVIPTYNYGRYIAEAIESVRQQTHKPLEIVVVDDGSTDNTVEVLRPYMQHIRYVLQNNSGLSAARNKGVALARGQWIAFLDSDDVWAPEKLAMQIECVGAHRDVVLVGCYEQNSRRRAAGQTEELFTLLNTRDFLGGMPFGASSTMARKDALVQAGLFDTTRRSVEDREMWLKLTRIGRAARVNVPLWTYRIHHNQMNANPRRMANNYRQVLADFMAKNSLTRSERNFAWAYFHYDSAMCHHEAGLDFSALRHLLASYWHAPLFLQQGNAENQFSRAPLFIRTLIGARQVPKLMGALRWMR